MEMKRLYRSKTDLMLGGVCGGLAKYLNVDPTIIRLVFVLLLFLGGGGFWIYLVLWIITPVEPMPEAGTIVEINSSKEKKTAAPPVVSKKKEGS